jgi:hypothetical protein
VDSIPVSQHSIMASFFSQILGTWELLSYHAVNIEDAKDVVYPMGKGCKGQIMYNNDGYMAAVLQRGDVEPYEAGWTRGTTRELANAGKKTMSYCGPFYVVEQPGKNPILLHNATISLPPNWINTIQLRLAEKTEKDGQVFLTLGPQDLLEHKGVKRVVRLEWRKKRRNDTSKLPQEAKEAKL